MTENDAKKIMLVMTVAYPNYKVADIDATAQIWARLLSDYTYSQVDAALRAYILTENKGFAPTIGQIVEKIALLNQPEIPTGLEAWAMVRTAASNSTYHAEEEFEKLPSCVQRAVGSPGTLEKWAKTEQTDLETVVQSNFLRTYATVLAKQKELQKIQGISSAGKQPCLPEFEISI